MRVVFMGTPDFAVPSLLATARAHNVLAVYTRADAVSGRGGSLRPSPVKKAASQLGIEIRQPATLREPDEWQALMGLSPDVIVVAAYGLILPREILDTPTYGCVNVHASLLPRWRGAAPVQRSILAGDTRTGVTIMKMEEGLDTGPFCVAVPVDIGEMGALELTGVLAERGAEALIAALEQMESGRCEWTAQDESGVTYAHKVTKDDVTLTPILPVAEALRRVRASGPRAPARVVVGECALTVLSATRSSDVLAAGSVTFTKSDLLLGFADGTLSVIRAKPEGKGEMPGCDWARGSRLPTETSWTASR
jgi:methionyl-tRNA formyltransferase